MKLKLILELSLFGLFMGFATVFFIPANIEPLCWLFIFITCAYIIAIYAGRHYFFHGFLVSILNCVWITGIHILLYNTYIKSHIKELEAMKEMNSSLSPRILMLLLSPVTGIIFGSMLGLLAWIASRIKMK